MPTKSWGNSSSPSLCGRRRGSACAMRSPEGSMSDAAEGRGYPGYVSSRPISGYRVPQHVQNLVIRDYAQRRGFLYKLSGTEYAIDHCYMMLEQLVSELPAHEGIIAYSMFMLPQRAERRLRIYQRILAAGCGRGFRARPAEGRRALGGCLANPPASRSQSLPGLAAGLLTWATRSISSA